MGLLPDINLPSTGDPAKDILQYKIELERRLRHLLRHIDISSIILGLTASRIVSTNAAGSLASVADLTSWIAGTTNQITVTNDGDGTVTLSLPQSIDASADVTFDSLTLDDLTALRLIATDGSEKLVSVADLTSWIAGTANQVTVTSDGDGTVTLSIPQDIHTSANPTFGNITGTGLVKGATGNFGNVAGGNYSEFESDGTYKANGDATTFDDLNGSVLELQVQGTGVSKNATENTADFTTTANLSDYLYDNFQIRHRWKSGSSIYPHIHWEQTENNTPNFLIRYRWQRQGQAKTTAWSDYKCTTNVFSYTSGTLNQISHGAGITPPVGYSAVSDIIEFRVFRDNADTSLVFGGADAYSTTVGITFIDIHIEEDTLGSRSKYTK